MRTRQIGALLACVMCIILGVPERSLAQGAGSTVNNAVGLWGQVGGSGAPCLIAPAPTGAANCLLPLGGGSGGGIAISGPLDSNGNVKQTLFDVHGTQADFTLPQPVSRSALLASALNSYALTAGGTAQTVAALNNTRQKMLIGNSDTTNTGEDLYVNCLGNAPAVATTTGGTIDLPPGAVYSPDVPPTQACQVIATTTGHTWEGYSQ